MKKICTIFVFWDVVKCNHVVFWGKYHISILISYIQLPHVIFIITRIIKIISGSLYSHMFLNN